MKLGVSFVAIQFEKIRLVQGLRIGEVFPFALSPVFYQAVGHCGDGQVAAIFGAEVPGAGILLWVLPEGGAKLQITAEGVPGHAARAGRHGGCGCRWASRC